MDKKTSETIVKIVAILAYIGAGLMVLGGIVVALGGNFLSKMQLPIPQGIISGAAIFVGIFMVAIAVVEYFIARGIWQHKNWARIVTIVFSVFGILSGLMSLPVGILGLLINGAIFYFFAFEKTTVKLFTK